MSTIIKIIVSGDYVAEVKHNGKVVEEVGPGWPTKKTFDVPEDGQSVTYEVSERPATESEVQQAKEELHDANTPSRPLWREKDVSAGPPARRAQLPGGA